VSEFVERPVCKRFANRNDDRFHSLVVGALGMASRPMKHDRHSLFAAIRAGEDRLAVSMPDGSLTYRQLRDEASLLTGELRSEQPLALWATPELATVIGLYAALANGTPIVPLNPKSGERELAHVLNDACLSRSSLASCYVAHILSPMRRISVDLVCAVGGPSTWPSEPPSECQR